jgi:hypothetical protein
MLLTLVFALLLGASIARAYSYHGTSTHPQALSPRSNSIISSSIGSKSISSTALLAVQQESKEQEQEQEPITPRYFERNTIALNERISRSVSFYSGILPIFIKYKALNLKLKANPVSEEEEERLYNELHDWGSEIVVNKVRELKGFYVKAGQIISTRVDIFPEQLMFGGFKNL